MKIITFAASKGGTGKTSLAYALAFEAAKHGTVFMADMDPQKSLTTLCEARSRSPDLVGDNPMLLDDVGSVAAAKATLERTGYARDFLIVDTPGSFMSIIKDAVGAADCVILPVQPSPLDILAQEDAARVVDEMGKVRDALFVINRVDGRSSVDDTMKRVEALFPNKPVKINNRVAYSRSLIRGMTGPELDKECAREITELWRAVKAIVERQDNEKVQHARSAAAGAA